MNDNNYIYSLPELKKTSAGNEQNYTLSLVIPTFQEAKNVSRLIERICVSLDSLLADRYELILVDDDSPDRTWEIAESLRNSYPHLKVIRRQGEKGLSTAVIRGWQAAKGSYLGVMDADLQHPPEVLKELVLRILNEDADLAVASRHVEGGGVSEWSAARRVISRTAQMIALILIPDIAAKVSDPLSGYFIVKRTRIEGIHLNPKGYKILLEVLCRGALGKIIEVPYYFEERKEGSSKVSLRIYAQYLQHLVILRFSKLPYTRFIRFCFVGLSGVFVDMTLLYLLHDAFMLNWDLTLSKIIAAELAMLNNYIWNDRWTFSDVAKLQPGFKNSLKRFIKFNLVSSIGILISVSLLNLLTNVFGIYYLFANGFAVTIAALWNYWMSLKLSWRTTGSAK